MASIRCRIPIDLKASPDNCNDDHDALEYMYIAATVDRYASNVGTQQSIAKMVHKDATLRCAQKWYTKMVHKDGTQRWYTKMGHKDGTQRYVTKMADNDIS